MSALTSQQLKDLLRLDSDKRADYLFKQLLLNQELWILSDSHGTMMLTSDDEDCVPVWPNEGSALMSATGEWEKCKAEKLSFDVWTQKWLPGLIEDDLAIAVFPNLEGESLVLFSDEFSDELARVKK